MVDRLEFCVFGSWFCFLPFRNALVRASAKREVYAGCETSYTFDNEKATAERSGRRFEITKL